MLQSMFIFVKITTNKMAAYHGEIDRKAPKDFVPIYTFKNNSVYRSNQTTKLEKLYIHIYTNR